MIKVLLARLTGFNYLPWAIGALAIFTIVTLTWAWLDAHDRATALAAVDKYKSAQAVVTAKVVEKVVLVAGETQVVYRDRIQKIYIKGDAIEKVIPDYVQPADDVRFAVNTGFLRVIDSAWAGTAPGPASDADREPSAVPLSDIAAAEVGNATSCLVWREQVIGWRSYYAGLQVAINGRAGAWYQNSGAKDSQGNTPITAHEGTIGESP